MGNYITLTNVSEAEFERILARKTSPLYISVHATDDDMRAYLIGNERARGFLADWSGLGRPAFASTARWSVARG